MPAELDRVLCNEPERYELREPPAWRFELDRRQFLETAGLLIVAACPVPGQWGAAARTTLEGRLHLGEDGAITILTGKIEEGQGPRTELTMAAAEELGVEPERVRMQMADTALVPNDGVTAGSGTTPRTVPAVRQAAAAARRLLIETAARSWQVESARLQVSGGTVREPGGSRTFSYAELARSPEIAEAYKKTVEGAALTPAGDWRVLGTPRHRVDGRDIVTGAHRYPSDVRRSGMLYGAMLRPPAYGAKLASVDLAAAEKLPGVTVVRDGEFVGCAAASSYAARKAVEAIQAQWSAGEHPASDGLFEYLKAHASGRPREQQRGAPADALKNARRRMQAAYRVAYVQHAPMEPRAAVAEWQDGRLTVWTGTSNPFSVRQALAEAFHLPAERVRVIVPDMGGGFGGKHTGEAALEAARLAKGAGRPVSLRWTRAEEFTWAYFRPAALIELEAALEGDAIVAWDFANYNSGAAALDTPYRIPNVRTRFISADAPLRQGSYRCLAATANNFAREAFTDELAHAAGKEPLEFRLAHLDNPRLRNVLTAAAERFRWRERSKRPGAGRGFGLACGTEKNSVVAACVEVEIDAKTGTPRLLEICEAYECGAILNPANLKSQVEGCIMMGLGPALREEIRFANGRLSNGRFSGYRVPRFKDMPKIEVVLLDRRDLEPAGAGETPIIAAAPAMANAVFQATGKRGRAVPFGLESEACDGVSSR